MRFGRVVTAMITPMHADGSVNYGEAASLASWLCNRGSSALVVCGTTGESPTLSDDEKVELFRRVVGAVGGRAQVLANSGGNDTRHCVELSKRAAAAGVDALLLVAPYYNKPPQAGLLAHFSAVAEAVDLPVMIYNIPGRTAVNVSPDTLITLADHERIVAVKESSGDLAQIGEIAARAPAGFDVYAGDDVLALPIAAIGGCGVVSVASHVAGEELQAMFDAFFRGDVERAMQLHQHLLPLFKALFVVTNPIPVKAAMQLLGFDAGICRPPLCALSAAQQRALDDAIAPWRHSPAYR